MLVAVHKTGEYVVDIVICLDMAYSTAGAASRAISRQSKITLVVVTAKQIQLAPKNCSANFHRVLAFYPRETVAVVKACLRDQIGPAVTRILQLAVVSTDESDAA